jgi:hypothetical protein
MREALDGALADVRKVDPDDLASALAPRYSAVAAAFGRIRRDRLRADRQALYDQVDRLIRNSNPVTTLAPLGSTHDAAVAALARLRDALQPADLVELYDSLRPRLYGRVPAYVSESPTGETIRTGWKELDPAPYVDELRAILQTVRAQVLAVDPGAIAGDLEGAYAEVRGELAAVDLAPLFALAETLETFRRVVGRADLDLVLDPVLEMYEAASAKLGELSPADVLAELETQFEKVKADVKALDPRLLAADVASQASEAIKKVDKALEDLDPKKLLGEPIDKLFGRVRAIIESLYPEELLDPLLSTLEEMRAELEEALDRVQDALDRMFGAVPV